MSDPSSTFVTAAFVAGVVEGSSVLSYHKNLLQNNEAPLFINIAAHATLYGVISLPLGLIGASPGMAFYPRALKLSMNTRDNFDKVRPEVHSAAKTEHATLHAKRSEDDHMSSSSATPVTGTGRGIGRFLRDKNLKKSHSSNNQQTEPTQPAEHVAAATLQTKALNASNQSRLSRYVSTLDGCALPTPLAEAMRRSRSLFLGAAVVSVGLAKYMTSHRTHTDTTIAYSIDEFGVIDYAHGALLKKRLRADIETAKSHDRIFRKLSHDVSSSMKKTLNWLFKVQDEIVTGAEDENHKRPIAIRLIQNDKSNMPFLPSAQRPCTIWPIKTDENRQDLRKNPHFFVLPIYFNHLKSPWWQLDSELMPLNELPVNSTWTVKSQQQQDKTLIIETNACHSIHDVLQNQHTDNKPKTDPAVIAIDFFTRMLLDFARTKCSDSVNIQTILIHDNGNCTRNQCVSIKGLDVLKWAVLTTINNLNEIMQLPECQADPTRVPKRLTQYSSDQDVATPWTVVDVVGTSIRHLLESTYRIASAVTYLKPSTRNEKKRNTQSINIVSHIDLTAAWLGNTLLSNGWKVKHFHPDRIPDDTHLDGFTLIMGRNDLETINLAYTVIERQEEKLLVLLEDMTHYEIIDSLFDQAGHDMVTIICASLAYEHMFATARSLLARGMHPAEVQAELERKIQT